MKSKYKISKINLWKSEFKNSLGIAKIFMYIMGIGIAFTQVASLGIGGELNKVRIMNSSLAMMGMTFFTTVFIITIDRSAQNRTRLVYMAYPAWLVPLARLVYFVLWTSVSQIILFGFLVPIVVGELNIGFFAEYYFKTMIPLLLVQISTFVIANYLQSFATSRLGSNGYIYIALFTLFAPVWALNFANSSGSISDSITENEYILAFIPFVQNALVMGSTSGNWWLSIISIVEFCVFMTFFWKGYSRRLKQFYVSVSE